MSHPPRSLLAALGLALAALPARAEELRPGSAPEAPARPADFADDARLIYRVAACASDAPLPEQLDARVVKRHCKALAPRLRAYERRYVDFAKGFIAERRPIQPPSTVVYPFGGGDLISALTTFPDATEITTLSLEYVGDPRRLRGLSSKRLEESLQVVRQTSWGLLMADNSTTANLQKSQRNDIPGQLTFFLVALALHGHEPVSVRYFQLDPDGAPRYLSEPEIAALDETMGKTLRGRWLPPETSVAFANVEISFRPRGAGPDAPVRVHRHFAADLSNTGLAQNAALVRHLESKGRVAAMTKAASYLLWQDEFSRIRDWLLSHMEVMVSDSTGIPPRHLRAGGWSAVTYGKFSGSFLKANEKHNQDFRKLWSSQPHRPLPFRYGYLDAGRSFHLMVVTPSVAGGR